MAQILNKKRSLSIELIIQISVQTGAIQTPNALVSSLKKRNYAICMKIIVNAITNLMNIKMILLHTQIPSLESY